MLSFSYIGRRYLVNYLKNADVHRAGNGTFSTAHAEVLTKPLLVIDELVHGTLAPAAVLGRARVVTARHEGEITVVAGVVTLITEAGILYLFIGDLEAMAGGANKSAGVAADAVS